MFLQQSKSGRFGCISAKAGKCFTALVTIRLYSWRMEWGQALEWNVFACCQGRMQNGEGPIGVEEEL